MSSRYYPHLFDVILTNQIRYRQLFGDYMDFDCHCAVAYRVNAVKDVIFALLGHKSREKNARQKIIGILQHPEVKNWYAHLQTSSLFHKTVRFFISSSRYSLAFFCFKIRFTPARLRKTGKIMLKGTKTMLQHSFHFPLANKG